MTHPHDPPRQWSRPVEEVAKRFRKFVPLRMAVAMAVHPEMFEDTLSDIAEMLAAEAWADAVRLGFINENGIEAMKAEKEAK